MICKFFKNKNGVKGGLASIDYLLNAQRVKNGTAKILKGDEATTRAIIKSLDYTQKACVGCLSFVERDIPQIQKEQIISEFERTLMTDEMQGRYNILWVEHTDKGRLELNFVIPRIDLESKKQITPYFHKADLSRVDSFVDIINLEFNFADPKDPKREQKLKNIDHYSPTFKSHKELDEHLEGLVLDGLLKSRDELVRYLENDLKEFVEITRKGKETLSIKLNGDKKATKHKGEIFADGEYERTFKEKERTKQQRIKEFCQSRNEPNRQELRNKLERAIEFKAGRYRELHEKEARTNRTRDSKELARLNTQDKREIKQDSRQSDDRSIDNEHNLLDRGDISDTLCPSGGNNLLLSNRHTAKRMELSEKEQHDNNTKEQFYNQTSRRQISNYGAEIDVTENIRRLTERKRRADEIMRDIQKEQSRALQRDEQMEITLRRFNDREQEIKQRERAINQDIEANIERVFKEREQNKERINKRASNSRELKSRARKLRISHIAKNISRYTKRAKSYQEQQSRRRAINSGLISRLRSIKEQTRAGQGAIIRTIAELRNAYERIKQQARDRIREFGSSLKRQVSEHFERIRPNLAEQGKKSISSGGFILERALKEPQRARELELKRQRERQLHKHL